MHAARQACLPGKITHYYYINVGSQAGLMQKNPK
jgi:hypothetical protein